MKFEMFSKIFYLSRLKIIDKISKFISYIHKPKTVILL